MKKILIALVVLLLCFGVCSAYKTQDIVFKGTTYKDGFTYPWTSNITIKLAETPPPITVTMFVTRNNSTSTEPYAGPYKVGEGIRVHVNAQLPQGAKCVDRFTIEAPVLNNSTGQIEYKTVIDTAQIKTPPWCTRSLLGAHWDYDTGFPNL